jgi:hypothetical protein
MRHAISGATPLRSSVVISTLWLGESPALAAGVEHRVDLVVRGQVKLVHRRLGMGLDYQEGTDITIEELGALSLYLELVPEILGAEVYRVIDLVFWFLAAHLLDRVTCRI